MLPIFVIIGAQKAGTTTLCAALNEHPQIYTAPEKEVYYFTDPNYAKGLDWYRQQFPGVGAETAIGEASPRYMVKPDVPGRIRAEFPEMKLIAVLRNPVERAYSEYWYNRVRLQETASFEGAIAEGRCLKRGNYADQIGNVLESFPSEQLLVVLLDDLKRDALGVYESCCEFLGVDRQWADRCLIPPLNQTRWRINPLFSLLMHCPGIGRQLLRVRGVRRLASLGPRRKFKRPPMRGSARSQLVEYYRESNRRVGEMIGRERGHWNTGSSVPDGHGCLEKAAGQIGD